MSGGLDYSLDAMGSGGDLPNIPAGSSTADGTQHGAAGTSAHRAYLGQNTCLHALAFQLPTRDSRDATECKDVCIETVTFAAGPSPGLTRTGPVDQVDCPYSTVIAHGLQPGDAAMLCDMFTQGQPSAASGCVAIYDSVKVQFTREQQRAAYVEAVRRTQNPQLQLSFTEGDTLATWGPGDKLEVLPGPRPEALAAIMMSHRRLCIVGRGKQPPAAAVSLEEKEPSSTITVRVLLKGTQDTLIAPLHLFASSGGLWLAIATLSEAVTGTARVHVHDGRWWSPIMEVCSFR